MWRGNLIEEVALVGHLGSIPACAGEPLSSFSLRFRLGVYPRVCGGTTPERCSTVWQLGLSPRVRGNPSERCRGGPGGRSIPACAGEPPRARPSGITSGVYPRVCGGTLKPIRGFNAKSGLSPACAGEPRRCRLRAPMCEVYPRVCGGTGPLWSPPEKNRGLSPRVRGNRFAGLYLREHFGSIPACAGEPGASFRSERCSQVYPRVCGGTDL